MDYAFCLDKGFDLEFLISLENELLDCSDDPNGNKRRLMFKFRLLYAGCVQNRCKNCPGHNVKEAQEAQRRCEAMSNNHIAIGETNQEATLTYHWERKTTACLVCGFFDPSMWVLCAFY